MIAEPRQWGSARDRVNLSLPGAQRSRQISEDEGKRMSRNGNRISKLIVALGVFGLSTVVWVPRMSAEVTTFSVKNYNGSYACRYASSDDFFTAVSQYTPNGAGGYTTGTLVETINNFDGFDEAAPASQFCTFFLQPSASFYSIDTTGLGFEELSWIPSVANDPVLCFPTAFFIDQDQIALRNLTSSNGATIRAEVSDDNLLGTGTLFSTPGHGTCVGG